MIFDNNPNNWQELQAMTAQMFSEIGCISKPTFQLKLVRGVKEIDVYVEDIEIIPRAIYLCECKFWNKHVEQEVVHSFRTVVSDAGANAGFIISKLGFQAGAYEAIEKTNIKILTFIEFQALFFDRWLKSMALKMKPMTDQIFPYVDPVGGKMPQKQWGATEQNALLELSNKYEIFIALDLLLMDYTFCSPIKKLPFEIFDPCSRENKKIMIESYRQLFNLAVDVFDGALNEFRTLFGENR